MVFIHAIGVQISLGSPFHNSFSFTQRYQHIRVLTYTSYISALIKIKIVMKFVYILPCSFFKNLVFIHEFFALKSTEYLTSLSSMLFLR